MIQQNHIYVNNFYQNHATIPTTETKNIYKTDSCCKFSPYVAFTLPQITRRKMVNYLLKTFLFLKWPSLPRITPQCSVWMRNLKTFAAHTLCWSVEPPIYRVEGDEQPNHCQTCMECWHACAAYFLVGYKHGSLPLGLKRDFNSPHQRAPRMSRMVRL